MDLDWGDAPAPDLWTVPDASKPMGGKIDDTFSKTRNIGERSSSRCQSAALRSSSLSPKSGSADLRLSPKPRCDEWQEATFPANCGRTVIGEAWVWPRSRPRKD